MSSLQDGECLGGYRVGVSQRAGLYYKPQHCGHLWGGRYNMEGIVS